MKRLSKETKLSIIISLVVLIILTTVGVFFHKRTVDKVKEEANRINMEMSNRIQSATRVVYRAVTDIAQGQTITAELVQQETSALSDTAQDLMITEADLGKLAKCDIAAGEDIHTSMVGERLDKNWQEVELNCMWLSTNLQAYDYVDVRIIYPNGLDYVVVAKKNLQQLDLSRNNAFMWFTESELLNLNAAIVDANLKRGRIYTTKYVDPALEPANEVTYQPSAEIIDLIRGDANVLEEAKERLSKDARAELENRIGDFKDDYVKGRDEDNDNNYDFHLDTTTDAGTGSKTGNNNGYDAPAPTPEVQSDTAEVQSDTAEDGSSSGTGDSAR